MSVSVSVVSVGVRARRKAKGACVVLATVEMLEVGGRGYRCRSPLGLGVLVSYCVDGDACVGKAMPKNWFGL